jgi:hypothetical protein
MTKVTIPDDRSTATRRLLKPFLEDVDRRVDDDPHRAHTHGTCGSGTKHPAGTRWDTVVPRSRRLKASAARYASSTFSCDIARTVSRATERPAARNSADSRALTLLPTGQADGSVTQTVLLVSVFVFPEPVS